MSVGLVLCLQVWSLHHGLMRFQTAKHGGYESQTEGDR